MKKFIVLCIATTFVLLNASAESAGWQITTKSKNNYNGVTVANGRIGMVSGKDIFSVSDIVLNGVFDKEHTEGVSRVVRGPIFTNLDISIDGLKVNDDNIKDWTQTLNMKKAHISTSFNFKNKVKIEYSIMALRNLPYMGTIVVDIIPLENIVFSATNITTFPEELKNANSKFKVLRDAEAIMPICVSEAESRTQMHKLATCSAFLFDGESVEVASDIKNESMSFTKELKKGEKFRFALIGSNTSSRDFLDAKSEAERMTVFAMRSKLSDIIDGHTAKWDELWEGDIEIEGNLEDQLDVRLALYNLYSFSREGTRLSVAPMGLSTATGYNGHVFWDTEIWMYPPMLLLNQPIAKSFIDYRTDRLPKALQRAQIFGYKGAMYPWESDDSGEEATPTWCLTGTFEHHITADVGIAFWNYYSVTKDKEWLKDEGYKVLKSVADFWVSRVIKNDDGSYSIKNVIGANEFAPNVDDNAFTNGSAKVVLQYAVKAAKELGLKANPQWNIIADNIKFNYMPSGAIREHATYNGEIIKQADVNLLAFPLELITDKKQILRDLEYYEPKIYEDGPAMGSSILSILYSRLGNKKKAYELFKESYIPNKRPPFGVLSESAFSNNPYFATGAGGMLQAVISGFGGLYITDKGIQQRQTVLPKEWKSFKIKGVGPEKKTYTIK